MPPDCWPLVWQEKTRLIDELEPLSDEQWDAPTLCEGWRVRDIVAHIASGANLSKGKAFLGVVGAGFNVNKFIDRDARKLGTRPREDLTTWFRDSIGSTGLPPGVKPPGMLTDVVVHRSDIMRPLGLPHDMDLEVAPIVLDFLKDQKFFKAPTLRADLRLRATDCDWAVGEGAEVRGPGEALALVLSGRKDTLDELEGDGVATLRQRMKS